MPSDKMPFIPWTTATEKSETYLSSCHCGAVRYKFAISPPLYATGNQDDGQCNVIRCNCSICFKNGYLLVYPLHKDLEWMGDSEKHLKKYHMASKACPHLFCGECGSSIGPDITVVTEHLGEDPRFALNVRMIKDINLDKLKYRDAPGKDIQGQYQSPV